MKAFPEKPPRTYFHDPELYKYIRDLFGVNHTFIFSAKHIDQLEGIVEMGCSEAKGIIKLIKIHGRIIFEMED